MKRKAFLLLSILVLSVVLLQTVTFAAQNEVITFPDQNFEAAVREQIGKSSGTINKGDVENVTFLNIASRDISNLEGIEHFTAIEELYCQGNQLITLDLSKNTALNFLWCGQNQLALLDVTKNTLLMNLNCSNNRLTTLDVSRNTALEELSCAYNRLATLDVTENTALKTLWFEHNQLTALDVSKNTKLVSLMFDFNRLKSLDVRNNSVIKTLYCSNNQLTSLDLSRNTTLETLSCSYNQLTALDLDRNTALTFLDCRNNYFPNKSAIIGVYENSTSILFEPQRDNSPASSWAYESVDRARELGLLPALLDWNYQEVITRAEFCALVVALYEEVRNEEIVERVNFDDTIYINVEKAAAIGVVEGIGDNKFAPNRMLTREQAATMLSRLADVIGEPLPQHISTFTDVGSISFWALEGVGQVQASGIMLGVGNNRFAPKEPYTREQSIVTMVRLYDSIMAREALLLQNLPGIIQAMPEFKRRYPFDTGEDYGYMYLSDDCRVILAVSGDLDGNGIDDFAIGLEFTEKEERESGVRINEFGSRQLYVLLGQTDGSYIIIGSTSMKDFLSGGVFGDPLVKVEIDGGILCIEYYGGSSSRWGYDIHYIFDGGQMVLSYLKEYSHSTNTLAGEETIYDYVNFIVEQYEVNYSDGKRNLIAREELPHIRYPLGSYSLE